MNVKNEFIKYYNNNYVQNFIFNINQLDRGDKGSLLSTLLSFNFYKDDIHTFKIYAELYRKFSDEEILKFLPECSKFNLYFPYWNDKRSSSLCFGIKMDTEMNPIYYTHIKFDPAKRIFEEFVEFNNPKLLDIPCDFKSMETGISFEYYLERCIKKRYWYFYDDVSKKYITEKFNMDLLYLDHIEYTEYEDDTSKIILIYDYPQDWGGDINKKETPNGFVFSELKKFNYDIMDNFIDFMKNEFRLSPRYFGTYNKDGIVSVYWSLTKKWNVLECDYLKNHIKNI